MENVHFSVQLLNKYIIRCAIRELKHTDAASERRRSHSNFFSIKESMMSRAD